MNFLFLSTQAEARLKYANMALLPNGSLVEL